MAFKLRDNRTSSWLLVTLVALSLLIACGGPSNEPTNQDEPSAQSTASNGGQSQSSTSGQGPSENGFAAANPCDAFSMIGGAAGLGFMGGVMGGPSVETADSPSSDFAANLAQFTEEALEAVFDGNVSQDCFIEVDTEEGGGVWIALTLPEAPPSGVAEAVGSAMESLGATVAGAFSANSAQGSFDLVSLESLPFESPSGSISMGGLYFVTSQEGFYQAVMLAGYDDGTGRNTNNVQVEPPSESGSGVSGIPPTGVTPATEPTVVAVTPGGVAGSINDELQSALEDALGVGLIVESFFQTSAGGNDSVSLFYVIADGQLDSADAVSGFTKTVEDLGGTVAFSMAAGGGANVTFQGLSLGELTLDGNLGLSDGKIFVTVSSIGGS